MKCIITNTAHLNNKNIWSEIEKKYCITVLEEIKEFLKLNSGGNPKKEVIVSDDEEYEVRKVLSLDKDDKAYYIEKPLKYFLDQTQGKIIPIGVDSGDNYYCVNNETGKVYYWSSEENQYYCITDNLESFLRLFG